MTTLVVGASGETGKLLVEQLLEMGQNVKVIVRPASNVPKTWESNTNVTIIRVGISGISVDEAANYVAGCDAIACCLGHNLTLKGIYGKPRKLVTDAVKLLCAAVEQNVAGQATKFVLMNTSGNRNKDLNESISFGERIVVALVRFLVPPHTDNEQAAEHLRVGIGQNNPLIEWVAVRPDNLIDQDTVTEYELHPSPIRSAIFNAGKTSRINVGNFMARLITEADLWEKWKGKMPLIYNISE